MRMVGCLTGLSDNAKSVAKNLQSFIYFFKSVAPDFFVFDVPYPNDYYADYYSK